MCNEEILQIATASLFQVLLAVFLPNIIWIGLQLVKLLQNIKGWTFWDTRINKNKNKMFLKV